MMICLMSIAEELPERASPYREVKIQKMKLKKKKSLSFGCSLISSF